MADDPETLIRDCQVIVLGARDAAVEAACARHRVRRASLSTWLGFQTRTNSVVNVMACAGEAMTALLPSAYVCPNCKTPLVDLYCASCAHQYELSNGFPKLVWNDAQYESTPEIIDAYDSIYSDHSGVWENQGRSREFIQYFAGLLRRYDARRLLEVGCGEGVLLAALAGSDLYGTELSTKALERARTNVSANLCIALGERLPFCDQYFDLIASVGVMEHFLDDHAASREICRVLKDGGHYVVLIHVHLTAWQSVRQKISEYVYPRPTRSCSENGSSGSCIDRFDNRCRTTMRWRTQELAWSRAGLASRK